MFIVHKLVYIYVLNDLFGAWALWIMWYIFYNSFHRIGKTTYNSIFVIPAAINNYLYPQVEEHYHHTLLDDEDFMIVD